MDTTREIFVSIMIDGETVPVGRLWSYNKKGRESASFEYDKSWLMHPRRFALEPALPTTIGQHYTEKSLFGAIGDSAPDRWGRVLMQRANTTTRTLMEIDYLLGVNDETRQGALRFSEKESGPYLNTDNKSIPPLINLPELFNASEKFIADNATDEDIKLLLAPGSSLGGAWPKASVIDKDDTLAIAKFSRKDDMNDTVRWEAVALTLAKNAGINVNEFRLESVLGNAILIVKRFDRDGQQRIPFLSAMSMLGAFDKDGQVHSHTEIATAITQHGAQPNKDLEKLWRRMIFEIMISNKDNHLRNHGFLYTGKGWTLSPAYDLNPDITQSNFAVTVDHTGATNTIEGAKAVLPIFRITPARAGEILDEVRTAVSDWRKVAKQFGITENKCERMKSAFTF